jgi:hypothetical protein
VIRLVRADLHLMDAALASDDALAAVLGHDVVAGWATFTAALQTTRDAIATNTSGARWGTRFFVAGDPPELVGWGGFKGHRRTASSCLDTRSPKPDGGVDSPPRRRARC